MTATDSKSLYRASCARDVSIPLFSQAWWLDAIVGEANWNVAVVQGADGNIKASMPYVLSKQWGIPTSLQPPLTQTLGPWLAQSSRKSAKRLADEKDLMETLIDQLPQFGWFSQNWSPEMQNWLPFYWRGFRQTTRYTYQLRCLKDEKLLWDGLDQSIRTDIRKASSRYSVSIQEADDTAEFLELNREVFARQGKRLPYSEDLVRRLDAACSSRGVRRILIARDSDGRAHAGAYLVWGGGRAYYLMGGSDPVLRRSGAVSLCLWEAVLRSREVASIFDFEGSMLQPVERFFRGFGAVQTPYFNVSRVTSPLLRMRQLAKELRR